MKKIKIPIKISRGIGEISQNEKDARMAFSEMLNQVGRYEGSEDEWIENWYKTNGKERSVIDVCNSLNRIVETIWFEVDIDEDN